MSNQQQLIKLDLNGELRRFLLKTISINGLNEMVKNLTNADSSFQYSYVDNEGDKITVSTDEELKELIQWSNSTSKSGAVKILAEAVDVDLDLEESDTADDDSEVLEENSVDDSDSESNDINDGQTPSASAFDFGATGVAADADTSGVEQACKDEFKRLGYSVVFNDARLLQLRPQWGGAADDAVDVEQRNARKWNKHNCGASENAQQRNGFFRNKRQQWAEVAAYVHGKFRDEKVVVVGPWFVQKMNSVPRDQLPTLVRNKVQRSEMKCARFQQRSEERMHNKEKHGQKREAKRELRVAKQNMAKLRKGLAHEEKEMVNHYRALLENDKKVWNNQLATAKAEVQQKRAALRSVKQSA